ncbi:NEDD4 family-interacting protein 1-like isoform X3 [Macrosteles quadrilineatus]|uniref:NEDD4 family-interacting protein 1-like isoform X3 n=1 Tax=Macrosteles quadrilineatus TaxID=74068 RepID=UPI0023E29A00|nr:NEDD4 family-interacting protein 1-like isoform X3 [Macrosteles quadrilineatus]XP_054264830.1 NEDD4 family-interacting protein 1-like isoform X3 [Macrosteles quadrilineatus]
MERHTSYEVAPQPEMNNSVNLTVVLPPEAPPVHSLRIDPPTFQMSMCSPHQVSMVEDDIPPPKADFSAPPPYDLATKLPTYEEVQREKTLQGELPLPRSSAAHRPQTLAFLAIDTDTVESDGENSLLGTDFMFSLAFFVAFLFNWIGFLLLMCFCHTVAARYGALSGFGLSLAKWTLIVKQSTDLASHENSWLWWLVMTFGLLICVRAIIQYLNIKRGWRLLSGSAQERLLFFY